MKPAVFFALLLFCYPSTFSLFQEDWNKRGESLLREGKFEEALEVFKKACEREPDSLPAMLGLGRAKLELGMVEGAISALEGAYKLDRNNKDVLFALGLALFTHAENLRLDAEGGVGGASRFVRVAYEDAKDKFMKVTRIDPLYFRGHQYLGLCYERLNEEEEAEQTYRKALLHNPNDPVSNMLLGEFLLYVKKAPEEAFPFLQEAENLSPDPLRAGRTIAQCLMDQGEKERAIAKLVSLLSKFPNNTSLLEDLWRIYNPYEEPDKTVAFYRKLFHDDKKNTLALWYSGQILFNEERYEEARKEYERLLEAEPGLRSVLVNIGSCYHKEGKLAEAREKYIQALEGDPQNTEGLNQTRLLAQDLANQGKFKESLKLFEKLIELSPKSPILLGNYALTLRNAGEYERAIEEYGKAIRMDPKDSQLYNDLGLVYEGVRNFDEALEWYEQAEAIDKNLDAMENRGVILFKYGKYKEAENQFRKVLEIDPERERSKLCFYRCKRVTLERKK